VVEAGVEGKPHAALLLDRASLIPDLAGSSPVPA
jgi:hypothetical protein